jgi:hypothetical protein
MSGTVLNQSRPSPLDLIVCVKWIIVLMLEMGRRSRYIPSRTVVALNLFLGPPLKMAAFSIHGLTAGFVKGIIPTSRERAALASARPSPVHPWQVLRESQGNVVLTEVPLKPRRYGYRAVVVLYHVEFIVPTAQLNHSRIAGM